MDLRETLPASTAEGAGAGAWTTDNFQARVADDLRVVPTDLGPKAWSAPLAAADGFGAALADPPPMLWSAHAEPVPRPPRRPTDFFISPDGTSVFDLAELAPPGRQSVLAWRRRRGPNGGAATYRLSRQGILTGTFHFGGAVEAGAWSPDGRLLALSAQAPLSSPGWARRLWGALPPPEAERLVLIGAATGSLLFLGWPGSGGERVSWSPGGNFLLVHHREPSTSPAGANGLKHVLRLWRVRPEAEAAAVNILRGDWPSPIEADISSDQRWLMLAGQRTEGTRKRIVVDLDALPPVGQEGSELGHLEVPRATEARWSRGHTMVLAHDGSFVRLGQASVWQPQAGRRELLAPTLAPLQTGWAHVWRMVVQAGTGRTAVVSQAPLIVGEGPHDSHAFARVNVLDLRDPLGPEPLTMGVRVDLNCPVGRGLRGSGLLAWAPPGPYQDYLAVALPDGRRLWIVDAVNGNAYQLAGDLGAHRWAHWSPSGQFLLVTDLLPPPSQPLRGGPLPPSSAQLRLYQMGDDAPILSEVRQLEAGELPGTTWAFASGDPGRVAWLLPQETEWFFFAEEALR